MSTCKLYVCKHAWIRRAVQQHTVQHTSQAGELDAFLRLLCRMPHMCGLAYCGTFLTRNRIAFLCMLSHIPCRLVNRIVHLCILCHIPHISVFNSVPHTSFINQLECPGRHFPHTLDGYRARNGTALRGRLAELCEMEVVFVVQVGTGNWPRGNTEPLLETTKGSYEYLFVTVDDTTLLISSSWTCKLLHWSEKGLNAHL
jgi:hypothetical protein